jgi:MFS family permease
MNTARQDARVIALVGLAHGTSHFSHLLLAPLFPLFIRDFGLSYAQVGWLMSAFFIVSGTGQALSGFVVDRVGTRRVMMAALSCFVLASLMASQADGYRDLFVVAVLAGLGNAPFHPVDFSILNQRVSSARLGHAFSVHGLSGQLGWALAPVFLVGIGSMSDWRVAYGAATVFYLVVMAVLWSQRQHWQTPPPVRPSSGSTENPLAYLRLPVVWWCFGFFLVSTMTLAVVQSYAPSILTAVHGVSVATATLTLSAYMLMGAVGMVVGGFVASRSQGLSSDRVVVISLVAASLTLMVCASGVLGTTGTLVALALTGFAMGVGGPSRDMMIKRATPISATGRVYGTVYSGLDVGFAISPLIFGWMMDRGWYQATLIGAALVLWGAVAAAWAVGQRSPVRP